MSDPYKNLEDQLRGAVERRAPEPEPAPAPRRRLRFTWPRGGAIPLVLGAVILGGGVATAAVVAQHSTTTATPEEQMRQAMEAGSRAMRTLPACRHAKPTRPRVISEPTPSWLTAKLGILRRQQTAADRAITADLRYSVGSMILADSRRVAVQPDGWSYHFRLERGIGSFFPAQVDPVGCQQGVRAAALAAATSFSPEVQRRVHAEEDTELAGVQRLASGRSLQYQITEVRPDGIATSSGGGSLIPNGPLPATSGMGTYHHGHTRGHSVYSLIPDGIATIRAIDTSGTPRAKPVTIKVVDNFFHTLLPRRFGPTMILQWRSASGRVVRTTHLHY
jgi:hypothetical protein